MRQRRASFITNVAPTRASTVVVDPGGTRYACSVGQELSHSTGDAVIPTTSRALCSTPRPDGVIVEG